MARDINYRDGTLLGNLVWSRRSHIATRAAFARVPLGPATSPWTCTNYLVILTIKEVVVAGRAIDCAMLDGMR